MLLFAVGVGNVWGDSKTFNKDDFSSSTSSTKTPITVTFSAKTISGQQIRFNSGATVTFTSSSGNITAIAVSTNSTNQYIKDMGATVSTGTWSGSGTSYSWSGNASSITMTAGAACRITTISVTYSAASCTTVPTVSAGSNSSVAATTATISCSGISSLGSAGCSISSYGFVIGSSANPSIDGSGVTKHEVGTSYTTVNTSFSKNLTGLSPTTTYYVRPYATNGKGTAYGTQTSFTTTALPKYMVTLKDDDSELTQASAGASVTLPERTGCTGYTFAGWTKSWNSTQTEWTTTAPTIIPAGSYTPNANENLYPVYTKTEGGGTDKYQKVTSTEGITDGQYLIVYETGNVAMNGGLATFDAVGNTISVTISNSAIAVSSTTTAAEFTIDMTNQTIKGASDKYIDRTSGTSSGALNTITSNPASHALSIDNSGNFVDQASVTGTHSYLKYNNASNQTRFRYYPNGQQDIQLYKRVSSSTTYYISEPNCCTPLAQVNGSFKLNNNSASEREFIWANETTASDVDHYELSYKQKNTAGDPTSIANNISYSTHTYTHTLALTEGNTYTYYLKAVGASGHCDATEEVDVLIPYATSTVTFNDNEKTSGSVPDAITQNTGTTVTVPGNTGNLAKDNYAFGGWNTKDDGTGTNYIADATFTLSNDITLYAKWDCAKKVTLTKGTPSNGSFSLSEANGDKYTCDGSVVVTVSDITPTSGYRLVGITQTGLESGVTIDQANKTVTYAQYANGSSTINVEFEEIPVYTITWSVNGLTSTTNVTDGNALVLPDIEPTSCDPTNYGTFVGWYTTAAGSDSDPSDAVSGTKAVASHIPTGDETYYAVWANGQGEGDFALVTNANQLSVGDVVTIANVAGNSQEGGKVIKAYNSGNNWPGTDVTTDASGKIAASTTNMQTFTLEAGTADNSWAFNAGDGYPYAASSGSNHMKKEESKSANSSFSLSIDGQSIASLVAQGTNTHNIVRFNPNNGSPIFSCYESATQSDIYLYKQESGATAFISTCCTKHTITLDDEIANGSVASTESSVCEGTSVTLTATATPNAGRFKTWDVTGMTLTNEQKATNPLTISMPDNDITVSATFDALYAITKVEEGGTITLGANYAAENDVVTISAVAKQDYEEPRVLKVYKTNDESTEITITNGQFTMPGYPVTAKVTYTPSKTPLPAPTMGANSDLTYNSVQLNWTNVANNSGYVLTIMQGEDVVEGYDAKAIDKDATSAVISGLEHLTAYTYTLYAKGDGETYVAVNTAANGGFTTLDYPTVKIYYSENEVLRVAEGEDQKILTDFTLPSTALNGCTQKELVGWTTAANAEYSHDTEAPEGMMLPGAKWQIPTNENCTLYAVYAKVTPEVVSWDATAITDLGASDIFVIVGNNGNNYVLPNDGGASSPTVAAVTIANNKLSAAPAANLQWNLSGNASGYTFYPNGSSTTWLYLLADNNKGVRIGNSESNKVFTINGGYLYCATTTTPRYVGIYNSEDWRCYTGTTGNIEGQTFTFYKKNVTPASMTKYATQCMAQVAKPVINGVTDGETYEEAKTITITSATNGATIYYTTDGTEPTTSSNAYSAPFEVSANGDYTIRAIAVKDEMVNSDEATAVSFTLDLPFTTIASFIEAAPSTAKKLVFTAESNARVLAYNKNRIYIQDGTGAMFLYNTGTNSEGHGKTWASGKKIVGTLTGTYSLTNNMPRMTVTDFGATDVTDDAIELPTPIAVEALATNFASNVCKLVTISGVSIRSESVADNKTIDMTKNNVTYNIYNAFNVLTGHTLPLNTTTCTVTGILGQSNSGTTLQLMPISADGISTNGAEAVLPVLSVTGSTNSAEPFEVATNKVITFTPNSNFDAVYAVNDGEETAVGNSTSVTITDEENATKVYIKATRKYYTTKEVSYYYRANSALIEYDITKGAMSHGSATIQNAQGDAITYAVGGATVTLVANPAEHYHWVSWEVTAGGEPVTVTNNTFEMPNAAVTVSATFEEDDYATVAFAKGNESVTGTVPTSQKVYVGENATMPGKGSMILSSHNFAGWKLGSNAVLNTGDTYTVTAADHEAGTITFEAQWEPYPWASAGKWELVTSASEITVNPTTYVIFADTLSSGNTACGLTQNDNNRSTVSVTKTDNLLTWTGADPAIFIVEEGKDQGTFAFYDAINNNYIHAASDSKNYLYSNTNMNTDGAAWTIDAIRSNGGATVTADTYTHNLLNLNGNICAAYTAPQKGLAIYKFVGGSYYNIVYAKGTEDEVRNMPEGHVTDENGEAAVKDNTPIRVGYTFTGWKDQDENAYTYNDGQIYAFTKNVTLTAQWEEQTDKYTVSYDANGSSDAVPAEAAYFENAEVTVAGAVSKEGFVFMGWECNGRVYTAGSKFYMPATDMPMVAKYAHGATYVVDTKTSVTTEGSVPEGSSATFVNTSNTPKQITSGKTMTLVLSGYTGYTIKGVQLNAGTNNSSGEGTLSITIGGDEVATGANADKWYDGNHHYGTNNGTDFESVLVSMNPKTVKYGEDIVITIAASENSLYCQSFTILYDLLPVEVENTTTIEARDLAAGTAVTIHDGGTLNVNADKSLDNLTVEAGGKVDGSGNLTVNDFTIEGQDGKSGQVMNADKLTINGDAYFDFTLAVSGTRAANQWHNFSVPFPVSVMDGVYNAETGAKLTNEVDYAIEDYHGDLRAQGKYGWKKYRGIMQPGITYSMTVNGDIQTFRFKKVAGAYSFDANPSVGFSQYNSGVPTDAGWNGLGNMRLCYASVNNENIKENSGVRYVQILNATEYAYKSYAVGDINLTVGSAFFIQAANNGTMTFAAAHNAPNIVYAPARTEAKRTDKPIAVTLSNENQSDRMYITASEDAKSEYQIGCDLQKMFATNTPQAPMIYSVNYGGIKLAAEEAPIVDNKASYALSLYAPANGTYRIETPTESDNADLYLTKDGRVIWNLSMNGYEVELTKGTTEGYGLLLVRKAPSVATGVDEPTSDSSLKGRATKVVIDEHVYILRDGQMYDVTGKAVK